MKFNDNLLRALAKERCEHTPIWLMRQAGRYMPEYRKTRDEFSFLELCKTPDAAVEVTLQPIRAFGLDAAILFSDILIPVEPMGMKLDFTPSPVIANPVRDIKGADALLMPSPESAMPFVYEIICRLVKQLNVPLIGFSGAPFTLACYMVEGRGSKEFLEIKKLMHTNSDAYRVLMDKLTEMTIKYLQGQINAGCPVVQIFDTWAGILSPNDYRTMVLPWVQELINSLKGAYVVYFAKGGASYFDDIKQLNCAGIGLDWTVDIAKAGETLGDNFCLQGNLDPAILFTDKETIQQSAGDILNKGKAASGHIFNLGHGIMPETPVENVALLVKYVQGYGV